MNEEHRYFVEQGPMSDPGGQAQLMQNIPAEVEKLVRIVQGTTLHIFWAERCGFQVTAQRREELQLRSMENRLRRLVELDASPITEARPVEKKLIGNCRDFSLMLAMLLRASGIPARARCGFGAYFMPDHFEDHWVGEYWNEAQRRWILVDAQLDDMQCEVLRLPFDPLDVPRDQFIPGGLAWQMCRSGQADPDKFGIADMHGLWFVRGDFIRDVAALNKMELLPWDCWGLIQGTDESLSREDYRFMDELAELTPGDVPEFDKVRDLYEGDARLRVPGEIRSYTVQGRIVEKVEGNQMA
jgi:hypothetical protein